MTGMQANAKCEMSGLLLKLPEAASDLCTRSADKFVLTYSGSN